MANKKAQATVTFKIEVELADLLNCMPNRSAFIRKAIAAQLGLTCPLCHGTAVVSGWTHERFAALIRSLSLHPCAVCGDVQPVPADPSFLSAAERARLDQFLHGGPLYCDGCFQNALQCGRCDWRITGDAVDAHMRSVHRARK